MGDDHFCVIGDLLCEARTNQLSDIAISEVPAELMQQLPQDLSADLLGESIHASLPVVFLNRIQKTRPTGNLHQFFAIRSTSSHLWSEDIPIEGDGKVIRVDLSTGVDQPVLK